MGPASRCPPSPFREGWGWGCCIGLLNEETPPHPARHSASKTRAYALQARHLPAPCVTERGKIQVRRGEVAPHLRQLFRPDLPRPANAILERRELLDPDRTARMHAAGRDADFGAKAELAAIG